MQSAWTFLEGQPRSIRRNKNCGHPCGARFYLGAPHGSPVYFTSCRRQRRMLMMFEKSSVHRRMPDGLGMYHCRSSLSPCNFAASIDTTGLVFGLGGRRGSNRIFSSPGIILPSCPFVSRMLSRVLL